jgi:hypothetical protein
MDERVWRKGAEESFPTMSVVEVLHFQKPARFEAFECLLVDKTPVSEGPCHVAHVDEINRVGLLEPLQFGVLDFKEDIVRSVLGLDRRNVRPDHFAIGKLLAYLYGPFSRTTANVNYLCGFPQLDRRRLAVQHM